MATKKFIVSGKVQGVGFRASVVDFVNAQSVEINGYVKNLKDGTVEVVAIGDDNGIGDLKNFLAKGPETADVENLHEEDVEMFSDFCMFTIKY